MTADRPAGVTAGFAAAEAMLRRMWAALGGDPGDAAAVRFTGERVLASCYPMSDLGAAAFAAAGLAVAELVGAHDVTVDRTLCTGWFHRAARPLLPGRPPRSPFHAMSRDFPTADGRWLRFQANYPHLRDAALKALDTTPEHIAEVVRAHPADALEAAVVDAGGAAAATRTVAEWHTHPQGRAVAAEPELITGLWRDLNVQKAPQPRDQLRPPVPERPLAGVRVLDLTRVLAGPLAARFLAACGAQVLRIDEPGYAEPNGNGAGELTLGKRCAFLDLRDTRGRERFCELLAGADVLVHGLRPHALERLGLGREVRSACRPGLVEVTLSAYGWSGPWAGRRGFDTLVQASCGLAMAGGEWAGTEGPYRWPLSILDHAAGYLMAAAAIRGLRDGRGSVAGLSLAKIAELLVETEQGDHPPAVELPLDGPFDPKVHPGPVRRLVWPLQVPGVQFGWDRPGDPYGSATPVWI